MKPLRILTAMIALPTLMACVANAEEVQLSTPAPQDAQVYFISPYDGEVVDRTFTVRFGLRGMGVAPAGVAQDNTGHHHLLIDSPEGLDYSMPLPASEQVIHFGKGQTETSITLEPGTHELQLVLGNHLHVPHTPPVVSAKITVVVR